MPDEARPGRLIIVDDEPVILDLLGSVFMDRDYEVACCGTGRDALAAMEQGVDVLLTDKNLPDIGGLELIRHARERQADAQAIIITGYASLDTALDAMQLDVFDYIVKPPKDIFDVQRKVDQAFDKLRILRENQQLLERLKQKNLELEQNMIDLKNLQAELIQSEKLAGIGTLAAGIAHEISSPLFGVMGLAEAIAEEEDLSLVRQYAADIVDYSRTIKEIVVQLSGYSRTASNEYLTTVELAKVVEDAAKLVARSVQFDATKITVRSDETYYINARTNEIQQVFVNLIKNAVEAVAEQDSGTVEIVLGSGGGHVWADVIDSGSGIPEDHLGAIFDPFFTTKPPGRGTGLGLNIVYRIVTKYRGTITVESEPETGTRFHLRFPHDTD